MGRFRIIVVTRMNSVSILRRINLEYVYVEIHVACSLGVRYFFWNIASKYGIINYTIV